MSEKHTPGKLTLVDLGRALMLEPVDDWPHFVGNVRLDGRDDKTIARQRANAARLAVCWNACQGIPTAALEAGAVAELLAVLAELLPYAEKHVPAELYTRALDVLVLTESETPDEA